MKKQSTKRIVGLFLAAVVVLGMWGALAAYQNSTTAPQADEISTQTTNRNRTHISYTAEAGKTALEQLKNEADNVVIKESTYGPYVDSIEGHAGGTGGSYWSFYIDGEMAEVGANSYTQKGGEKIEWKFQKL